MKYLKMFEILENLNYCGDKDQIQKDIREARKIYAELFAEEIEKDEENFLCEYENTIEKIIREAKKC